MSVYLDPSVLVSIVANDANSARARGFAASCGQPICVSDFGLLEVASVFARFVRTGAVPAAAARQGFADLRSWAARAASETVLQASDLIFAEASLLRLDLALKAPDALHIALAHRLGATLATFDRRQAGSATSLKVAVTKL